MLLTVSISKAPVSGDDPVVTLDCGCGDMVVERDDGSAVVLSSGIRESSCEEPEGLTRRGGCSIANMGGMKSLPSMGVLSCERLDSRPGSVWCPGMGGGCRSSGQLENPGGEGGPGWLEDGVGIVNSRCGSIVWDDELDGKPRRICCGRGV